MLVQFKRMSYRLLSNSCSARVLRLFSYDPSAEILDYATTKAAIVGFTKGLADKLLEKGIRVNCVAVIE
jgi:NAD(P)-dependent dehydrogenase (short-subunit alcohol dehydrogenase family)